MTRYIVTKCGNDIYNCGEPWCNILNKGKSYSSGKAAYEAMMSDLLKELGIDRKTLDNLGDDEYKESYKKVNKEFTEGSIGSDGWITDFGFGNDENKGAHRCGNAWFKNEDTGEIVYSIEKITVDNNSKL